MARCFQHPRGRSGLHLRREACPSFVCDRSGGVSTAVLDLGFTGATVIGGDPHPRRHSDGLALALGCMVRNRCWSLRPTRRGNPRTEVLLDWGDGSGPVSCIAPATYSRSIRTQLLDLSPCGAGRSAADLAQLEVSLRFSPESRTWLPVQRRQFHRRLSVWNSRATAGLECWSPWVRSKPDPTSRSSLTKHAAPCSRVHGTSYLPTTDLDVRWAGVGSTSGRSLFNGSLVAGSLGSVGVPGAKVGVVCCGAFYPSLVLTADTAPGDPSSLPRGAARIRLGEAGGTSQAVITDWQLCDGPGCEVQHVSPGPSP